MNCHLHCDGCIKNDKCKSVINAFLVHKQARSHSNTKQKLLPITTQIKDKTRETYNKVNAVFQENFPGMEFYDAEVLLPEINIVKIVEEKTERKQISSKKCWQSVENHNKETAVTRLFGPRFVYSSSNKPMLNLLL